MLRRLITIRALWLLSLIVYQTLWYGMMAVVVGSFAYINLTPHDWAGNLGYTKKDQEEQKKKKAQEEEEH